MVIVVITVIIVAIGTFFMIAWLRRILLSYVALLFAGNALVMAHDLYSTGYLSGWWIIGHLFLTATFLLGSFLGHMAWVLYRLR